MIKRQMAQVARNLTDHSIRITHSIPKYSLIWLHGVGGSAQNYTSFFTHSQSPVYCGCRVTLLQAPKRYVTLQGQQTTSWYDIKSSNRFTDPEEKVFNLEHIAETTQLIDKHVREQREFWLRQQGEKYLPSRRVFVGGMSQGGAMALHYGLSSPIPPGGVVSLSAYLFRLTPIINQHNLPVFLIHGDRDTLIRECQAKNSYSRLLKDNRLGEYRSIHKLGHTVCLQQIELLKLWLQGSYWHYCEQFNSL